MKNIYWLLVVGADTSSGVLFYTVASIFFALDFNPLIVLLTIIFAHWPDGDFIPYVWLKRREWKVRSHRVIGHHPLILLPTAALLGWVISIIQDYPSEYIITLTVGATIAHLINDSMGPNGLHWGSPFTWRSITLEGWKIHLVNEEFRQEFLNELEVKTSTEGEIGGRVSPPTLVVKLYAVFAWSCLLLFIVYSQN